MSDLPCFFVDYYDEEFHGRIRLDFQSFRQPLAESDMYSGLEVIGCTADGHRFLAVVDLARVPIPGRRWVLIEKYWLSSLPGSAAEQFDTAWRAGNRGFKVDYNDMWTPDIVYFSFYHDGQPLREEEMVAGDIITACDSEGLSFQVTVRYFEQGHELWGGHWGGEIIDDTRQHLPNSLCALSDGKTDWLRRFDNFEMYYRAVKVSRRPLSEEEFRRAVLTAIMDEDAAILEILAQ